MIEIAIRDTGPRDPRRDRRRENRHLCTQRVQRLLYHAAGLRGAVQTWEVSITA